MALLRNTLFAEPILKQRLRPSESLNFEILSLGPTMVGAVIDT